MVFEEAFIVRNLYSKLENPELVTQNRKQTFGDKRINKFPGEEKKYEMHIWTYPEILTKRENGRKTQHVIKCKGKKEGIDILKVPRSIFGRLEKFTWDN